MSNKSAYKLKGFGPLYIINLDDQPERMEWMANQLKEWEIEDYTRISAYDGRPQQEMISVILFLESIQRVSRLGRLVV